MVDARKILAVVAALLVAAWMSPCCCQSAWMAERGAQLVMGGAAGAEKAAGCSCCQTKDEGRTRDCCPEDGGTGCTWTGAKLAAGPTAVIAVAPVGVWVSIEAGELPVLSVGRRVGGEDEVGRPPGWDGSLLGLGCALLV